MAAGFALREAVLMGITIIASNGVVSIRYVMAGAGMISCHQLGLTMTKAITIFLFALTAIWSSVATIVFVNSFIYEGLGQFDLAFYEIFGAFLVYGFHMVFLCYLIIKSGENGALPLGVLFLSYGSFYAFLGSHGRVWSVAVLHVSFLIVAYVYFFRKIKSNKRKKTLKQNE